MEVYPFDFCNNRKEEQIDKNLRIVNYDDNLWQCDNYDDLSYKNHFVRESFNVNCTLSPCNCTIESLPDELLTEIFSFLDRRDRLACALVSGRWQRALDCPSLWKNMTISLDTDLIEPSTMLLTRYYHSHIKYLKLTWSNPELPVRWIAYKVQGVVKRACRYVMILKECAVQLKSFDLINWYAIYRFKKLMYHLSQFLRIQTELQGISFCNAQLHKKDFIKLLISCRTCEFSIRYINAHNSFYDINENIFSAQLITCMETFRNLNSLTIDYTTLCVELLISLLQMDNNSLEFLEIYVQDKEMNKRIPEEYWPMMKNKYPKLKVTLYIHYINSMAFNSVFNSDIPLSNLYLYFSTKSSDKSCKDIIRLICRNYKKSLEIIGLHIVNVTYIHEIIISILNKCTKLNILEFYGITYNTFINIIYEQLQKTYVKYFNFLSTNELNDDEDEEYDVNSKCVQLIIKKEDTNATNYKDVYLKLATI